MNAPGDAPPALTFRSFAKLNLYLDVLERREDGFHNIETIFQTVDLSDELRFIEQPNEVTVECASPDLSVQEENLVWKAAMLLKVRCDCNKGARIQLDKRIPIAAGLAGGSGNAAAALIGLDQLWGLGLSQEGLSELALELGSDVPYCTVGGTVAATGRGEILTPLDPIPETTFLLLHPPMQVSANRVYNHPQLPRNSEPRPDGMTESLELALHALDLGTIADIARNAMEDVVFAEFPGLSVLKQRLLDAGCASALMSGSGPSIFGVCQNREHAEEVARGIPDTESSIVTTVPYGVQQII